MEEENSLSIRGLLLNMVNKKVIFGINKSNINKNILDLLILIFVLHSHLN